MVVHSFHPCWMIAAASFVTLLTFSSIAFADELCSIAPNSYAQAKIDHPNLLKPLEALEQHAIASWFTDRMTSDDRSTMISSLLTQCSEDTRLSMVVYGIPNKDCDAGLSSSGSVKSTDDYKSFLKQLTDGVGDRKVLYVVEPDAVGLLAKEGSCGSSVGYLDNLKVAVAALSVNTNAELYVDVGYWMLTDSKDAVIIATIMQELGKSGRVKGVTINTSNYRSTAECTTYCTNFQTAMGSSDMSCIVDTSRNYKGCPNSGWCNVPTAGIGKPPSSATGIPNLDYFMWIKPPGESDGQCTSNSPAAGLFFPEGFTELWDQGYFVSEGGMKTTTNGTGDVTQTSSQVDNDTAGSLMNGTTSVVSSMGTVVPAQTDSSSYTSTPTTSPVVDSGAISNNTGTSESSSQVSTQLDSSHQTSTQTNSHANTSSNGTLTFSSLQDYESSSLSAGDVVTPADSNGSQGAPASSAATMPTPTPTASRDDAVTPMANSTSPIATTALSTPDVQSNAACKRKKSVHED